MEKERGYIVSRKYNRLNDLLEDDRISVVGFANTEHLGRILIRLFRDGGIINIRNGCEALDIIDRNDLVWYCERHSLSFIDPEPEDVYGLTINEPQVGQYDLTKSLDVQEVTDGAYTNLTKSPDVTEYECGYKVSKDYDKLKNILLSDRIGNIIIFGHIDDIANTRQQVAVHSNDPIVIAYFADAMQIEREEFIEWCCINNLSFIDPEPVDETAIYYADGEKVSVKDRWRYTDGNYPHQKDIDKITFTNGCYCYLIHGITAVPFMSNNRILWVGNRMTNVVRVKVKVEE